MAKSMVAGGRHVIAFTRDIADPGHEIEVKPADHYYVNSHSVVVLVSR